MDALMAALVAAALAQAGEQAPGLAAVLADRYGRPWIVVLAAALALAGSYALGVAAAAVLAPVLTPEAKLLLLALALALAGGAGLFAPRLKDLLAGWRLGAFATSLLGLFVQAFGDRTQFVVAALAARTDLPVLAGVGAVAGGLAVIAPAAMLGEARWRALPLAAIRLGAAGLLLLAGVVLALQAVSLA
jgi:Ca2+/H+ antiporter, TMEM165/GDT1 family